MKVIIDSAEKIAAMAAQQYVALLKRKPNAILGGATGSTPLGLYAELVRLNKAGEISFKDASSFNLDEYVGLDGTHDQSYRYFMDHNLFDHVDIDKDRTRVPSGIDISDPAAYDKEIQAAGGVDLQLLGIGLSGHIGFNEPLSSFSSRTRAVNLTPVTMAQNGPYFDPAKGEKMPNRALTMGVGTVLDAKKLLMLVTGKRKADIIAKALEGPMTSMVSGSAIQLHEDCTVIVDEEAAAKLTLKDYYHSAFANDPKWAPYR